MMIKVYPDKEKVKSIIELAEEREKLVSDIELKTNATFIIEDYYEIAKELTTAILLLGGIKTVGENAHKEMLDYLTHYNFSQAEITLLQDLRIRRNQSIYEGKQTKQVYLENNRLEILRIISKLKLILKEKLP
ncbi:MAG: hypothetical protein KKD18_02925 [Nanoarchaeota archaeon]|nr:hypothetical protein [Nanoarchaeota archaeon]MBU0977343.1 hypothetical protein [Nanoarchaeota archaeon]